MLTATGAFQAEVIPEDADGDLADPRPAPTSSSSSTTRPTCSATWPTRSPRRSRRSPRSRSGRQPPRRAKRAAADGRRRRRRARAATTPMADDATTPRTSRDRVTMRLAAAELVESREILPGPVAAGVPRAGPRDRLARRPVRPRPDRATSPGWCCAARSRSTRPTPATGIVTIHFRVIGRGTDWFTRLRPGDEIDLLGPLGRPFEVDPRSQHLLLIAGGLGMAGVRMLADEAIRDGRQVTLLFGAAARARSTRPPCCPTRSSTSSPPTTARSVTTASSPTSSPSTRPGPTRRSPADRRRCSPRWRRRRRADGSGSASPSSVASGVAAQADPAGSPAARRKAFLQVSMEQNMGCAVGRASAAS